MDNIGKIIDAHNKCIFRKTKSKPTNNCNCRESSDCPLSGKCLSTNNVYKAIVDSENDAKTYIGLCETEFKTRFNNHKSSFTLENKKNSTELSKYILVLKNKKS